MGWEQRHGGKWYLYRNCRVNGKPVKEYLAAEGDFGSLMAHDLARLQKRQRKVRKLTREVRSGFRKQIDGLLADLATANTELRVVAEGLLCSLGYHRHHRGEWRMKRELLGLKALIGQLQSQTSGHAPLVRYDAPAADTEAVEVFQNARAGDAGAIERVQAMIRDRKWADWIGDLGRQATRQLVAKAAGGDAVWEAGIAEKANALRRQLLGDDPSVLEELLVRRVVNGWIATHVLELELTVRPPAEARDRTRLDAALTGCRRRPCWPTSWPRSG